MSKLNLTCFFQLRELNRAKRQAVEMLLSEYTHGAVMYLDWCLENIDYIKQAGIYSYEVKNKKGEIKTVEQYNQKSIAAVLPKASTINIAVSSQVKDSLLSDCSAMIAGYLESLKVNPKTSFPSAFKLVEENIDLALQELRYFGSDVAKEREHVSNLLRKPKSKLRPAYFSRGVAVKILTDEHLTKWYVWLNALSGKNDLNVSSKCDGSLIDINTGERFKYKGVSGLLLPIEIGWRNNDWYWQFTHYLLPTLQRAIRENEPEGINELVEEVKIYPQEFSASMQSAKLVKTADGAYRLAVSFEFIIPTVYEPKTWLGVSRDTLWDWSYGLIDSTGQALDSQTKKTDLAKTQIAAAKRVRKKQKAGLRVTFRDYSGDQLDGLLHSMANQLIDEAIRNQAMIVCESTDKIITVKKKEYMPILRRQFGKLVSILQYKCKLRGVPLRTEMFGANAHRICVACGTLSEKVKQEDKSYLIVCLCGSTRLPSETSAFNIARRIFYRKSEWEEKGGYLMFHKMIATNYLRKKPAVLR